MFLNDVFIRAFNFTIFLCATVDSTRRLRVRTLNGRWPERVCISNRLSTLRARVFRPCERVLLNDGHSDDGSRLADSRDAIPQACLFIISRDKRTLCNRFQPLNRLNY